MNNKHIACLVLVILCILTVQGVAMIHKRATKMQGAAASAKLAAENAAADLSAQRAILDDLVHKTADLHAWLGEWESHLARIPSAETAEINVTALLKQANLVLLAQRFEVSPNRPESGVPNSADATIPQFVRAHLTIEDDFVKTVNWLGDLESKLPIARISDLQLARGQSGNDIRMNVVVDIPLAAARPAASLVPVP